MCVGVCALVVVDIYIIYISPIYSIAIVASFVIIAVLLPALLIVTRYVCCIVVIVVVRKVTFKGITLSTWNIIFSYFFLYLIITWLLCLSAFINFWAPFFCAFFCMNSKETSKPFVTLHYFLLVFVLNK